MGEKYLNAIDKPVPGLITHADSGLHIDHAPQFLQTPLWAASGLPPTSLAYVECVEGDLRRPGGGLRFVARGTPGQDPKQSPKSLPLPHTLEAASVLRKGGPGRSLGPSPRCACTGSTGVHAHAHAEPGSCCILFQDRKSGDPRGGCQSPRSRGYKLIKRFPALSQGPESRVRPEEEGVKEEEKTNVQLIL